jgi:hypothetical protein
MEFKAVMLGLSLALAGPFLGGMDAGAQAQTRRAEPPAAGLAVAIFAGGCFWCMEPPFDKLEGVVSTTSGYTGGTIAGPSYKQVSAGGTVIAHPTPASLSSRVWVDSTNRTVSSTEARLALAVLTTERKAA